MFFKKKKSTTPSQQDTDIAGSGSVSGQQNNSGEKNFKLEDFIKACDHYAGTKDEAVLVKTLADCLLRGSDGIKKDLDMALKYYSRLLNLNRAEGLLGIGQTEIYIGIDECDSYRFSVGVQKVYESYKLGNKEAVEVLEIIATHDMFENISTLDELIRFCEKCFDNG